MHKVENVSREKMWAEGLLCGQSVKYELGNCPIYSHVDKREKCVSVYKMGNNIHLQTIFSGKQYPLAQALFYHQPRKNIFGSQTLKYLIFCTTVQFKCTCLIPETPNHQYGSIIEVEFSNIQTRSCWQSYKQDFIVAIKSKENHWQLSNSRSSSLFWF